MDKRGIKDRLLQPITLIFLASLVYNLLKFLGIEIPVDEFKILVDGLTYIAIGYTVYHVGVKPVRKDLDGDKEDNR